MWIWRAFVALSCWRRLRRLVLSSRLVAIRGETCLAIAIGFPILRTLSCICKPWSPFSNALFRYWSCCTGMCGSRRDDAAWAYRSVINPMTRETLAGVQTISTLLRLIEVANHLAVGKPGKLKTILNTTASLRISVTFSSPNASPANSASLLLKRFLRRLRTDGPDQKERSFTEVIERVPEARLHPRLRTQACGPSCSKVPPQRTWLASGCQSSVASAG